MVGREDKGPVWNPEKRPRPASGDHAPAGDPVREHILALQQSAGNMAVSAAVLSRDPVVHQPTHHGHGNSHAPEPEGPPKVASWGVHVIKGGEGAGAPRHMDPTTTRIFKGDKAIVSVEFDRIAQEQVGMSFKVSGEGVDMPEAGWKTPRRYETTVTFAHVGHRTIKVEVGQGPTLEEHDEEFTVVADLQDFALACTQAQAKLLERFAAAQEKINIAASAFRKAYDEQDADLKDVSAQEKMIEDLIWGAVFAAAGGLAGGALGGWLKTVNEKALKDKDWLIDTAKDVTKFAVRSGDRLRGGGHGGPPSTAGDSTAPGVTDPGKPSGERKASGKNPLDFLTDLEAAVAGDGREAHAKLGALVGDARAARDADSKADFEEDPVELVARGTELGMLTNELQQEKKWYLKGLWKSWLGAYAWKINYVMDDASVESNVGRKVHKKIQKAAEDCGETADQWIQEFGLDLKGKLEKEAEASNVEAAKHTHYEMMGP